MGINTSEVEGDLVRACMDRMLYEYLIDNGAEKPIVDNLRESKGHWELLLLAMKMCAAQFQVAANTRDKGELTALVDQVNTAIVHLLGEQFGEYLGVAVWNASAEAIVEILEALNHAKAEGAGVIERMTKS